MPTDTVDNSHLDSLIRELRDEIGRLTRQVSTLESVRGQLPRCQEGAGTEFACKKHAGHGGACDFAGEPPTPERDLTHRSSNPGILGDILTFDRPDQAPHADISDDVVKSCGQRIEPWDRSEEWKFRLEQLPIGTRHTLTPEELEFRIRSLQSLLEDPQEDTDVKADARHELDLYETKTTPEMENPE